MVVDYLRTLGLRSDATRDDIEETYQAISDFLSSEAVPRALRQWASEQSNVADEAYAVLIDPGLRPAAVGAETAASRRPTAAEEGDEDDEEGEEWDEEPAPVVRASARSSRPAARRQRGRRASRGPGLLGLEVSSPLLAVGGGLLLGIMLLGGVVFLRPGPAAPAVASTGSSSLQVPRAVPTLPPLDTARVAELEKQAAADPTNRDALFNLGETYIDAGEWQQALTWFQKLVALDPENAHAWTDIGTGYYNLGNYQQALETWKKVAALVPDDPQVHYNLGFLYANVEPADYEAATREWQRVVDLAPNSDLARTVQVHLQGLKK